MKLLNRGLAALAAIVLLISILPGNLAIYARAEGQSQVLAQWSFDNDATRQPDQAIEANELATIESNADAIGVSIPQNHETPNFGAKGFSASTVGQKGFTTTISTLGYENIKLSSKQRSSNTGPLYFNCKSV